MAVCVLFKEITATYMYIYIYMQGIWGGMIGGLIVQTLVLIWVTLRTDWNKEVL